MKTAREMFEELGFKFTETEEDIRYKKITSGFNKRKISISFDFDDETFYICFYYFDYEFQEFQAIRGCEIDKDLLKAIYKQCEELGWL